MSSLKGTVLANLREMVKLQRAAHDSMFKFSITKLWPICLFTPQVDWIRITRMMNSLLEKCEEQKEFLAKERGNAPEDDMPALNLLPEYIDALASASEILGGAAAYRQDVLERKRKMRFGEWNSILKNYNVACDNMAKAGVALYKTFV
ncbi:MAG: hypothetical protein FWC26_08190 [Fibromonadales bacterium]|nr:hypothetical protein [Fibromonadales bacterium]